MLALSRSQKLPQPGEDTQVRDTVYTYRDNTQSMTEIACFKVTEIQLHLLKQLIRVSIKMMNYYMLA